MKKIRLFISNFMIYGFGGALNKLVPFIVLPILVRLMPDSSYLGMADLSVTMVALFAPLANMGLCDAMYRQAFEEDDNDYKKKVISTAILFSMITSFIVTIIILALSRSISILLFGGIENISIIVISAFSIIVSALYPMLLVPIRMINNRLKYILTNLIYSLLTYIFAFFYIANSKYEIALPISYLLAGIIIVFFLFAENKKYIDCRSFDRKLLGAMLLIGMPLMPNLIFYSLMHSCDRIMISQIIGVDANGVYSVAAKYGGISQLIYLAFSGGWHFFSFSTMKDENQIETVSKIFEYLCTISAFSTMLVCLIGKVIWTRIFDGDYTYGYIVLPYMFISPLLQMLFLTISNQYLVIKKTGPSAIFLFVGVMINIICNSIFIPMIGIEGAALATFLGNLFAVVICAVFLCYAKLLIISKRLLFSLAAFGTFFFIHRLVFDGLPHIVFLFSIVICIVTCWLYWAELKQFGHLLMGYSKN